MIRVTYNVDRRESPGLKYITNNIIFLKEACSFVIRYKIMGSGADLRIGSGAGKKMYWNDTELDKKEN